MTHHIPQQPRTTPTGSTTRRVTANVIPATAPADRPAKRPVEGVFGGVRVGRSVLDTHVVDVHVGVAACVERIFNP